MCFVNLVDTYKYKYNYKLNVYNQSVSQSETFRNISGLAISGFVKSGFTTSGLATSGSVSKSDSQSISYIETFRKVLKITSSRLLVLFLEVFPNALTCKLLEKALTLSRSQPE